MKRLFGILLLLNIIFFAYMQWGGALMGAAKNGQAPGEMNAEKIKLLDIPPVKSSPASEVLPVQQAEIVSVSVAASASTPTPALVAISAPLPASAAAPVPAPPPVLKTESKTCMEWGEFSGTDLARAEKSLSQLELGDRLARRTVEYASGYWVYIPPLKNQAAVRKKIEQIKALGVHDYYVVQEPPHRINVISLGVFKTRESAQHFLASLNKKGVRTAKVDERKLKLKFTVFVLRRIDTTVGVKVAALQKYFVGSDLKTMACK